MYCLILCQETNLTVSLYGITSLNLPMNHWGGGEIFQQAHFCAEACDCWVPQVV